MHLPRATPSATTTRRWRSPRAGRGDRSSGTSANWWSIPRAPISPWLGSATCRAVLQSCNTSSETRANPLLSRFPARTGDERANPAPCRLFRGESQPSTAPIEAQISHVYRHYCKARRFLAVVRCMPQQSLLRYQPRLSVLGCFALLHVVRFAKRQNAVRTG